MNTTPYHVACSALGARLSAGVSFVAHPARTLRRHSGRGIAAG
jgi:hypothetical protein